MRKSRNGLLKSKKNGYSFVITVTLAIVVLLFLPAIVFGRSSSGLSLLFNYGSTEGVAVIATAGGDPCNSAAVATYMTATTDGTASDGVPTAIDEKTTSTGASGCLTAGSTETEAKGSADATTLSTSPGISNELTGYASYTECPSGTCPSAVSKTYFYNELQVESTTLSMGSPVSVSFTYDMKGTTTDTTNCCNTGAELDVYLINVDGTSNGENLPCVETQVSPKFCQQDFVIMTDCLNTSPCNSPFDTGTQSITISSVCQTPAEYTSPLACPSLVVGDTFIIMAGLQVENCLANKMVCPSTGATVSFADPMSIQPITTGAFLDDLATGTDLCPPRVSTCGPFVTPVFPLGTVLGVAVPLAALTAFAVLKTRFTKRTAVL